MIKPLISIIVPCYNQAQYLSEALQSVLEQTYANWECIIVNDGSPDNTHEVVQEWLAKDVRFKYILKENGGVCSARNYGINNAKGEIILPLDADDKIANKYIELAVNTFQETVGLKVVYCNAEKFGRVCKIWDLKEFSLENLAKANMIFCTAFFRKEDWIKIGGYDEKCKLGLEDWEFWISLLKNGGKVLKLDYLGFYYRVEEVSRTTHFDKGNKKELYDYISKKHASFFIYYLGSFMDLQSNIKSKELEFKDKLSSEKYLFTAIMFRLTGWPFFKNRL